MKQEYVEMITKQMQKCDNIQILDIIHKLLIKSNRKAGGANA